MPSQQQSIKSIQFLGLFCAAFFLAYVPYIHIPFDWIANLFHELSQTITSYATGGSVKAITLLENGQGKAHISGGIPTIILLAGYGGTVLWGLCIALLPDRYDMHNKYILLGILIGTVATTATFWAHGTLIFAVLFGFTALLIAGVIWKKHTIIRLIHKLLGLYVLTHTLRAPFNHLNGKPVYDSNQLEHSTDMPEFFWVMIWLCIGVIGTCYLWKHHRVIAFHTKKKKPASPSSVKPLT